PRASPPAVPSVSSAAAGGSYGSATPVNSGISPDRAFAYSPFTSRASQSSREVATWISTKFEIHPRISSRTDRYGEIAAVTDTTPFRASTAATHPIRRMFLSRSSFENPSPFDRCSRTSSPSSSSTRRPRERSSSTTMLAIVLFPAPERPVNHRQQPGVSTGAQDTGSDAGPPALEPRIVAPEWDTGDLGRGTFGPQRRVRRLRHLRAGPARRPLAVPRSLRTPAPRPGKRRHRR